MSDKTSLFGTMALGSLISEIKKLPDDCVIVFDFCRLTPKLPGGIHRPPA